MDEDDRRATAGANAQPPNRLASVLGCLLTYAVMHAGLHGAIGAAGAYVPAYAAVLLGTLALVAWRRQPLGERPANWGALRGDGRIVLVALGPALAIKVARFLWPSGLGAAAVALGALVLVACLLRQSSQGMAPSTLALVGLALLPWPAEAPQSFPAQGPIPAGLLRVAYMALSCLAEEALFRGYLHTRLETALGQSWRFFGVPCGPGAILAAALFGLWHAVQYRPAAGGVVWFGAWGAWTFCAGLFLGYLRARSGRIIVPTLLHWLINI